MYSADCRLIFLNTNVTHMDTMYNICCFNALKLNGKDTPLLNFTANIIEVLGFS